MWVPADAFQVRLTSTPHVVSLVSSPPGRSPITSAVLSNMLGPALLRLSHQPALLQLSAVLLVPCRPPAILSPTTFTLLASAPDSAILPLLIYITYQYLSSSSSWSHLPSFVSLTASILPRQSSFALHPCPPALFLFHLLLQHAFLTSTLLGRSPSSFSAPFTVRAISPPISPSSPTNLLTWLLAHFATW